jgi:hypothetical protein
VTREPLVALAPRPPIALHQLNETAGRKNTRTAS